MPEAAVESPYLTTTSLGLSALRKWLFCDRHEEILSLFSSIREGMPVVVLGQRKIGKTFLLIIARDLIWKGEITDDRLYDQDFVDPQLAATLRECLKEAGQLDCVYLTLPVVASLGEIFGYILKQINDRVPFIDDNKPVWERIKAGDGIPSAEFEGLIENLSNKSLEPSGKRLVLLMDEFESVLEDHDIARGFFTMVGRLAEKFPSSLSIVLAGARNIPTGMLESAYSPLSLRSFSLKDRDLVEQLIQQPAGDELQFDDSAVDRIIELSGRHPFLIQVLCEIAFEHYAHRGGAVTESMIDDIVDDVFGDGKALRRTALNTTFEHNYDAYLDGETRDVQREIIHLLTHRDSATMRVLRDNLKEISAEHLGRGLEHLEALGKISRDDQDPPGYRIEGGLVRRWLSNYHPYRLPPRVNRLRVASVLSWIAAITSVLLWVAIQVYNSPALAPLITTQPGSANIAITNNAIQVVNSGTDTFENADIAISLFYPGRVRPEQDAGPIAVSIECRKRLHRDIVIHLKEQHTRALEIIGEPKRDKGFSGPYIERNLRESSSGTSQLAFRLRHGRDLPKEINLDVEITLDGKHFEPQRGLLRMSVDWLGPYLETFQQVLTFLFGTGVMGTVFLRQMRKERT